MSSSFELFKKQLDDAVRLIQSKGLGEDNSFNLPSSVDELVDTQSLIARCEAVCKKHKTDKPVIRVIHHLACSGGTLFSKCLSALPNVYLLSEVHPHTELAVDMARPNYSPTDITSLAKYAKIPLVNELADKIFKQSVIAAYEHVEALGGTLVLRDHTHADFNTSNIIPTRSRVAALLEENFEIESILSVRDPIDSYSSLVKNGWVHFEPKNFDEYCRRLLILLKQFPADRIFSYELFSADPKKQLEAICKKLDLPFDETFENTFPLFKVTGDSGRTAGVISRRERIAPQSVLEECEKSVFYQEYKCNYHVST